jgi:hypothetical protein
MGIEPPRENGLNAPRIGSSTHAICPPIQCSGRAISSTMEATPPMPALLIACAIT